MLAAALQDVPLREHSHLDLHSQQDSVLLDDRLCPGCKKSAVNEQGGLVVAFGYVPLPPPPLFILTSFHPPANLSFMLTASSVQSVAIKSPPTQTFYFSQTARLSAQTVPIAVTYVASPSSTKLS